ncbi:hypothetical protein DRN73_05310 [Candidatus Pacearchaeota archaeon]|nr:MAG: hypothetical protein DRN73_05310 [Candidatus Pacearchaeota archaeon]
MEMKDFIKMHEKMDIFEKAIFYLASLNELEKGYRFCVKGQKEREYIRSIGYGHIIIENEYGEEIADLGQIHSSEELINILREYYKNRKVREISLV